jgi:hypothetical protein
VPIHYTLLFLDEKTVCFLTNAIRSYWIRLAYIISWRMYTRFKSSVSRHIFSDLLVILLAEETEDDEVAGAVWYSDLPHVPEDKVPSLTDKTFTNTRDKNDLLVVNFFQPCEYY